MKPPLLKTVRIRNFKAIRDTGPLKLGPLTVLIGNNGSGKSSLIEAMETYQEVVTSDLDTAMQRWLGFRHVRNRFAPPTRARVKRNADVLHGPMMFEFRGSVQGKRFLADMAIDADPGENTLSIERERFRTVNGSNCERDASGKVSIQKHGTRPRAGRLRRGDSVVFGEGRQFVEGWQFVRLNAEAMGWPIPQRLTGPVQKLEPDGSNIAQYLWQIRTRDPAAFEGIVEALKYVLPFSSDVQPTITQEIERTVYLQMTESDFKVPGWLLSTGTLRVLALLALLRNPDPPPLLLIEEIENGLDPRTVHLLVEELRAVIESGTTQVIMTTHSPYLLDLLDLSHIVIVEREEGQPVFRRPDAEGLAKWSTSFSPGRLYTMGRLTKGEP